MLEWYNQETRRSSNETGQGFQIGPIKAEQVQGNGVARVTVRFPSVPKLPNADRFLFLSLIKVMMRASWEIKVAEVKVEIDPDKVGGRVPSRIRMHRSAWDAAEGLTPGEFWDLAEKENVGGWWK